MFPCSPTLTSFGTYSVFAPAVRYDPPVIEPMTLHSKLLCEIMARLGVKKCTH